MSVWLAMLVAAAPAQQVVFTHHETREPTAAQIRAYESGDRQSLIRLLPIADRVVLRLKGGETKDFSSAELKGHARLEVDDMGYFLRFGTGAFEHKSQMLLQECSPVVFYAVRVRAGSKSKIVAQKVTVGDDC